MKFIIAFLLASSLFALGQSQPPTIPRGGGGISEGANNSFELCTGLTPPDATAGTHHSFQSITHPDVYYNPRGFANYRYWMVATPYPDLTRENPCIYRSHNGADWEPITGNPIYTYAQTVADTYEWNADTDLIVTSNGVMSCYWMQYSGGATPKSRLVRKTSSSGVGWGNLESIISYTGAAAGDYNIISPAFVNETNGTVTMFYCRQTSLTMSPLSRIAWRSSADNGATFGAETICTYATNRSGWPTPWHINVERAGGTYYALVKHTAVAAVDTQIFGISTNKTDWQWYESPAIYNTGLTNFDFAGSYRSAFVVRSTLPLRFDVWHSGVPRNYLDSLPPGIAGANQPWRIGLFRNTPLPTEQYIENNVIVPPASLATRATAQVWFGANFALGNRFTLTGPTRMRYINFEVGTASGNIEVGIVRFRSDSRPEAHLTADTLYTSGVIACPTAGNVAHDMGAAGKLLGPGSYAVYLWCDNTTAAFFHAASADAGWLAGSKSSVYTTLAAASGYAITPGLVWLDSTDRSMVGMTLSNY